MERSIQFQGIGFEIGQNKRGLIRSATNARLYFSLLQKMNISIVDQGDVLLPTVSDQTRVFSENDFRNLPFESYREAYEKIGQLFIRNQPLVNWGGDHSVGISTVGAFCNHFPQGHVLWIDAHADLNLPEHSKTGNLHGMPLSILLDLGGIKSRKFKWMNQKLDPKKLIYLGLRDLDPFETETIEILGIRSFTFDDIQRKGMSEVSCEIAALTLGLPLHVSFDIDAMDPLLAPSTGVPVNGGLNEFDLEILSRTVFEKSDIRSVDVVEINPALGTPWQVEQTYRMAFQFLKAVFINKHGGFNESMGKGLQRNNQTQMEPSPWIST